MRPSSATSTNNLRPPAGERPVKKPARALLMQCDRCAVKGTGWARGNRIATVNIPAEKRQDWHHRGCGGVLVPFDLEGAR
jgi:hypothetical protein